MTPVLRGAQSDEQEQPKWCALVGSQQRAGAGGGGVGLRMQVTTKKI